jgi:hypothetical protein
MTSHVPSPAAAAAAPQGRADVARLVKGRPLSKKIEIDNALDDVAGKAAA